MAGAAPSSPRPEKCVFNTDEVYEKKKPKTCPHEKHRIWIKPLHRVGITCIGGFIKSELVFEAATKGLRISRWSGLQGPAEGRCAFLS
ncbi:hypothetical protein GDO78_004580 [Eleutherodactylus coqui]|uniref:Uncharacterized protein n=1 Tax=Eleutherodactylus coqui TaxID=57060 RepID=A0A8J6ET75_ELECQ|nr:hypothetical protein GDO78_004580 [Eleutherodactylus coqui]